HDRDGRVGDRLQKEHPAADHEAQTAEPGGRTQEGAIDLPLAERQSEPRHAVGGDLLHHDPDLIAAGGDDAEGGRGPDRHCIDPYPTHALDVKVAASSARSDAWSERVYSVGWVFGCERPAGGRVSVRHPTARRVQSGPHMATLADGPYTTLVPQGT